MLTPLPPGRWNYGTAAHLLNRAGFGGPPAGIEQLARLTPAEAVARLLDFARTPDPLPRPGWARVDPDRAAQLRLYRNAPEEEKRRLRQEQQRTRREQMLELQHWWLRRMAGGERPLQEKLTLFWHGHFATSVQKVREPYLMWRQNDLFRRLGTGRWRDLLAEVTRDPAMLIWLDQAQSKPRQPNENYARELMELFTLGEGHYTEQDVTEAARALTGLALDREQFEPVQRPRLRDPRHKTVLGRTGNLDVDDVLDAIVAHPQCPRFITGKLWRFFAGTEPEPELAGALATEFSRRQQQIGPFLGVMLLAEEFYAPAVVRQQIKSPVQLLVQTCRQLERPLPAPAVCAAAQRQLGQELFNPPNVKGWDGGIAWINTNTLLARHELATLLVTGRNPKERAGKPAGRERMARAVRHRLNGDDANLHRIFDQPDTASPEAVVAALERRCFHAPLPPHDREALASRLRTHAVIDESSLLETLEATLHLPAYQLT